MHFAREGTTTEKLLSWISKNQEYCFHKNMELEGTTWSSSPTPLNTGIFLPNVELEPTTWSTMLYHLSYWKYKLPYIFTLNVNQMWEVV